MPEEPAKGDRPDKAHPGLDVSAASTPLEVPVFNCLVYVGRQPEGGVRARVANLDGLNCEAANERAALAIIVPAFKQRVAELTEAGTSIPWIDPPAAIEPDEQARYIPVHL